MMKEENEWKVVSNIVTIQVVELYRILFWGMKKVPLGKVVFDSLQNFQ